AWAVVFAGFCAFLGLYATQPILPLLGKAFHAGKAGVSLTLTASTIGVALAAPLVGSVADRLGRKRVIVASATLLALATCLDATATSLPSLIFWRFLQGVFTPGVFAVTVAYVQDEWAEGGAGGIMALYVTGTVIGGFTGRLTTGIIAAHVDWRWSFLALGLLGAVSAVALQAWLPRERHFGGRTGEHSLAAGIRAHLRNPRLLATFAAGFGVLFSLVASYTYVTFYLSDAPFHLGPIALSFLFFTYLIGAVVTPPCGKAIDRFGQRTVLAAAMGAGSAGMLLTLLPNLACVVAGLALCCSSVFVAQSAANSYIGMATDHDRALAVGLYVTCYYLGGSAGSELPGSLWHLGGWPACVALVVLVQLLTIAIALACWSPSASQTERDDLAEASS
ncbi:MAG TPA: MFS transporter, partial [Holophaga sp.]|nr:MFS transporter [Holophaga sp.]